jgi:hypothetical protein
MGNLSQLRLPDIVVLLLLVSFKEEVPTALCGISPFAGSSATKVQRENKAPTAAAGKWLRSSSLESGSVSASRASEPEFVRPDVTVKQFRRGITARV